MSMSDPIADMLTRIRNASQANKVSVCMPASRSKAAIAVVLQAEGYIEGSEVHGEGAAKTLQVRLKYFQGSPVIEEIKRASRPGCRIYARSTELPAVRDGLGVALISTSQGVMSDKLARQKQLGGEVLCTVF